MIARSLIRSSVGRGRLDAMHIKVGGRGRTSAGPIKESAGLLGRVDLNEWDVPEMGLTSLVFTPEAKTHATVLPKRVAFLHAAKIL